MNNFLAKNWFKISFLVIILLVSGFSFYWFSWRPSQIKKECFKTSQYSFKTGNDTILNKAKYEECLKKNGL